jgi:hypothetical protein
MSVEEAFGILKGRWRILMKGSNVPLQMVPDLVCTCIVLHNLCITMKDSFENTLIDEAEIELAQKIANDKARKESKVHGTETANEEMKSRIQFRQYSVVEDVVDEENEDFLIAEKEKDIDLL